MDSTVELLFDTQSAKSMMGECGHRLSHPSQSQPSRGNIDHGNIDHELPQRRFGGESSFRAKGVILRRRCLWRGTHDELPKYTHGYSGNGHSKNYTISLKLSSISMCEKIRTNKIDAQIRLRRF